MKRYIIENAKFLSPDVKKAILGIVMMEVGPEVVKKAGSRDTEIDLDKCSQKNKDIIRHIHNMVHARVELLMNRPAGPRAGPADQQAEPKAPTGPTKASVKSETGKKKKPNSKNRT